MKENSVRRNRFGTAVALAAEKGGVVTIAGPWKGEESVAVDFGWRPKVRVVRDRDFDKDPLKTVEWGALVFAQPVAEKWSRVERPKPSWGKDSAPTACSTSSSSSWTTDTGRWWTTRAACSPRWPVTPYRELRYVTGYESVGRYVDCRYVQTEEGFRYHLRSPAKKVQAHLLVPSGKTPKTLRVNGAETPFTLVSVGESQYVDVTVTPAGGVADFEVLY